VVVVLQLTPQLMQVQAVRVVVLLVLRVRLMRLLLLLIVVVVEAVLILVLRLLAGLELFIFAAVLKVMRWLQQRVMVLLQVAHCPALRLMVFHTTC
jgi:hypothetical protein